MGLLIQGRQANPQYLEGYIASDSVTSDPLAGSVDNLDVPGQFFASQINLQASAAFTLTGLVGGRANKRVLLVNQSAFDGTISANDSGSDAENRFAADITLSAGFAVPLVYNADLSLWIPASSGSGGGGGTPGGNNTEIQFNNAGAFAGDAEFTYDSTSNIVRLGTAGGVGLIRAGSQTGASGNGGQLRIQGGAPGSASGNGGTASVFGGIPNEGNGGVASIVGADGVGTNRNGGNAFIQAGAATGSGTAGVIRFAADGGATTIGDLASAPQTGAQTATFVATNKPGSGTAGPTAWLEFRNGATIYWIPLFGDS